MNLFILLRNKDGSQELVTPPLDTGVILPGVTRRSIVEMVSTWPGLQVTERRITMKEVMEAHRVTEVMEAIRVTEVLEVMVGLVENMEAEREGNIIHFKVERVMKMDDNF